MDFAIPGDHWDNVQESEKLDKYWHFVREMKNAMGREKGHVTCDIQKNTKQHESEIGWNGDAEKDCNCRDHSNNVIN